MLFSPILEVYVTLFHLFLLRFGFVEFESEENCKAVKEAMEDCEIDGSKVTVDFAKLKSKKGHQGVRGSLAGRPAGQPAGQGAGRRGQRGRGGNIKGGRVSKGGNRVLLVYQRVD